MILDCFTFSNELDVLELRLTILENVVDRFVLCEAPFTFRGAPKPLTYAQNRARFARWNDRIVHLVYDAAADPNPWLNEWGQRDFLTTAVAAANADDLILIGDVDEIPAPELAASRPREGRVLAHRHRLAIGYVNRVAPQGWLGTRAVVRRVLGPMTLNHIRSLAASEFDVIESGWHFSSLGGPAIAADKHRAYSHVEVDIPYFNDDRRLAVQFGSEWDAQWVPLDDRFPPVLHEARWSAYVLPQPPALDTSEAIAMMHAEGCFGSVPAGAAAVAVVAADARAIWQRVGDDRFGAAFAGAHRSAASAVAAVPAGGWIVFDGLERIASADLAACAAKGINAVAFARNARSYAVLNAVLDGEPFPPGRALTRRAIETLAHAAAFAVTGCDALMSSLFAPSVLDAAEPFEAAYGLFRFPATTRAAMDDFATDAFVLTLRPIQG